MEKGPCGRSGREARSARGFDVLRFVEEAWVPTVLIETGRAVPEPEPLPIAVDVPPVPERATRRGGRAVVVWVLVVVPLPPPPATAAPVDVCRELEECGFGRRVEGVVRVLSFACAGRIIAAVESEVC